MSDMLKRFLVASSMLNFNTGEGKDGAGSGGEGAGSGGEGAGSGGEGAGSGGKGAGSGDPGAGGNGEGGAGGRGGEVNYFDLLPENVKDWDEYKNAKDPESFWQQIESHRKYIGQSIRIPGPDAGKEDWEAFNKKLADKVPDLMRTPNPEDAESMEQFYARMGRPESPDKYVAPEVKDADGNPVENFQAPLLEPFKEVAHAEGLSQKAFESIVKKINDHTIAQNLEALDRLDSERKAISDEWGAAEDKNYKIIANFAKLTDAPEHVHGLIANKEIDSATANWLLKAAKAAHDPEYRRSIEDDSFSSGAITPAEAAQQINEIMNNKQHPYWNKMDPGHRDAVAKVRELHILKDPKNARKPAPGTSFSPGSVVNQ